MVSNDPFPMHSTESRRLEESVESTTKGTNNQWKDMNTGSAVSGENSGGYNVAGKNKNNETEEVGMGLLFKKTKQTLRKQQRGGDVNKRNSNDDGDDSDSDDEFLDSPLRNDDIPRWIWRLRKVGLKVHKRLYGNQIPPEEILRTLCLASTLFFTIGGYWLLRSLKDPVLTALCGVEAIPWAKILSMFVALIVVSVYNRLLDQPTLPRHHIFYIFGTFYFGLFTTIAAFLQHPIVGLANVQPSFYRILGWISYCGIESFGSVMVSLFWSFANSSFNLETAKASYGLLVATAQMGSILGPTIVNRKAVTWGIPACYLTGAICMLFLQFSVYTYVSLYGVSDKTGANNDNDDDEDTQAKTQKVKKKSAGILEGLYLFVRYNYIKGIFAISCLFMIEVTIIDYTMKVLANEHFSKLHPCTPGSPCWNAVTNEPNGLSAEALGEFTTFMGFFGQATNFLSLMLSFFGTSAVIRYLGFRLTLLLFPSLCLAVIILVRMSPSLYVVFTAMMILKANSYALNNPTKEMLYQPTSSAVKYKAKSWIDMFGARGSKAMGSLVTGAFSNNAASLINYGSLVVICLASFLIWNARYMGKKFDYYIETGYIVGSEEEEEQQILYYEDDDNDDREQSPMKQTKGVTHVELAMKQNEKNDTSCAIDYEEDDEIGAEEEGQSSEELEVPTSTTEAKKLQVDDDDLLRLQSQPSQKETAQIHMV